MLVWWLAGFACVVLAVASFWIVLKGLIFYWIIREPLARKPPEERGYALAICARVAFRPLWRAITRRHKGLESDLKVMTGVLALEGIILPKLEIRVLVGFNTGDILAEVRHDQSVILVSSQVVAQPSRTARFFVVGHEVGHVVDHAVGRAMPHRLLQLIANYNQEDFSDAIACYCLETLMAYHDGHPLEWENFASQLPALIKAWHSVPTT